MTYFSTKQYGHEVGLSCAFRQHKADSHCRYLHGYALAVKFIFCAEELDVRNWVADFGGFKSLKAMLENTFDHKLLVTEDDPYKDELCALAGIGVADVVVIEKAGCEAFAELIFECTEVWLKDNGYTPRVRLWSVEVKEHGANSAIYMKDKNVQ